MCDLVSKPRFAYLSVWPHLYMTILFIARVFCSINLICEELCTLILVGCIGLIVNQLILNLNPSKQKVIGIFVVI